MSCNLFGWDIIFEYTDANMTLGSSLKKSTQRETYGARDAGPRLWEARHADCGRCGKGGGGPITVGEPVIWGWVSFSVFHFPTSDVGVIILCCFKKFRTKKINGVNRRVNTCGQKRTTVGNWDSSAYAFETLREFCIFFWILFGVDRGAAMLGTEPLLYCAVWFGIMTGGTWVEVAFVLRGDKVWGRWGGELFARPW